MAASPVAMNLAPRYRADRFKPLAPDSNVRLLSGREMPALGLGTWQLKHQTVDSVAQAIGAGYRLLDTSEPLEFALMSYLATRARAR